MELRSGLYKGVHGVLPLPHRAQFEEGVNLLFSSWTALCLAIDNAWGGPGSRQKAEQLYQDVLCWFYGHTEHYADDLEVDLEACMLQDFNVELQDDSPRQVSIMLVSLHQECLQGNFSRIQQLQQRMNSSLHSLAKSQPETVDRDGTAICGECMDSSDTDSADDCSTTRMQYEHHEANATPQAPMAVPLHSQQHHSTVQQAATIDADGFKVVQKPIRRRAGPT
ncbi:hypothetical protein ABBQ38_000727 [Trebouxia sp. C0009 RCD-2024]